MVMVMLLVVLSMYGTITTCGATSDGVLTYGFYEETCPYLEDIVRHTVASAVYRDPGIAASLLRLHFHDCFVMGCDASVLLDSIEGMISEKQAGPNINSLRGFEVIDRIKHQLEEVCPCTVSCADILAIVARDAVELRGGPRWVVMLGRRDSLKASFDGANTYIPAPNSSLDILVANFKQQGLDESDLVALSGSHTIGKARCLSFRQGLYGPNSEQLHYDHHQRYTTFRRILRSICLESGRDNRPAALDYTTQFLFDNHYYINILQGRGLLPSDNVLLAEDEHNIAKLVREYAYDREAFFRDFIKSMVRMGNINVITGEQGEIRRNCQTKAHAEFDFGGSLPVANVQSLAAESLTDIPPRYLRLPDELGQVWSTGAPIPIIDMSKLSNGDMGSDTEMEKLHPASKQWGFFQLINHGITEEVIQNMNIDTEEFFKLPLGEKMAYAQLSNSIEGYSQAFVQSEDQKLDWGDVLFLLVHPPSQRNFRFWPKHPASFRATLEKYSFELAKVELSLLQAMAKNLKVDPDMFASLFEGGIQGIRTNYSLSAGEQDNEQRRLQEHKHSEMVNPEKERPSIAAFHSIKLEGAVGPLPDFVKKSGALYKTLSNIDYITLLSSRKLDGKSMLDFMKLDNE